MTKEERWRMEGMSFCLRYLEQNNNDVEGMKKEIRRRGASSIPLGVSTAEENRFCRMVRENCIDTVLIQTLAIRTWEDESAPVDPYRAMLVVLIWPVMVLAAVAIGLYRLWKEAGKDD